MNITRIDFADIPQLSARDKAYQSSDNPFRPFMAFESNIESFEQAIHDRANYPVDRDLLTRVIKEQYASFREAEKVMANVELLVKDNSFTIITAHQPSLFTGPLYYIHKIFSAINLAERLDKEYPDYKFVPVFVTGGEDHDFDEINKTHIFNRTITWQQDKGGSVGRLSIESLAPVIEELKEILSDKETGNQIKTWIDDAFTHSKTYGEFAQRLTHNIFKQYGLVVLNMDHKDMKKAFIPIMAKEIVKRPSQRLVNESQAQIEALGYSAQAHVREINLFYLMDGARERLLFEDGVYKVNNTDIAWSESEILQELKDHPDQFSPNVVMRPLYQESILPNLAYVGGGGELAYWLERKSQFAHFEVFYPMLVRRASVKIISKSQSKAMDKLGIDIKGLFDKEDKLINQYLQKATTVELDLSSEQMAIQNIFNDIALKAKAIDPTLEKKILAEGSKQTKVIDQLKSRIKRTLKAQEDTQVAKIRNLKSKLFPNLGLQERHDNFFQYYDMLGSDLMELLKSNIDALQKGFMVVSL